MKIGFLFAGQGSQFVGMGKEFYEKYPCAKAVYDAVEVDFTLNNLCFEGPKEMLDDTAYAQCCILTTSLAIAETLRCHGIESSAVAGLSLGEYSALCYAKAMDIKSAASIVRERGKIMANALPKGTTTMAAVLGLEAEIVQEVCALATGICEVANYNCPGQIVITGENEAVQATSALLIERGARRVIPLNVSGAFHSSLLENASKQLNKVLQAYHINKPVLPVFYNISGKQEQGDIVEILTQQIKSSVYFMQSVEAMIAMGIEAFVEIGPGSALSSFVRKINKEIPVYSVDSIEGLNKALEALK